jgi:hypothetical protein
MLSPKPELIWQGRVHLGDSPGVFADASYSGLAVEFPVTLTKRDATGSDATTLRLRSENVETYEPYPGHRITVTLYEDSGSTILYEGYLVSGGSDKPVDTDFDLDLAGQPTSMFIGVRVQVDTSVRAGLYDDFVVTQLWNKSDNYNVVAALGFNA